jgi:hypothetical protein
MTRREGEALRRAAAAAAAGVQEETGMAADHERGDRCHPRAIRRPATRPAGLRWRGAETGAAGAERDNEVVPPRPRVSGEARTLCFSSCFIYLFDEKNGSRFG